MSATSINSPLRIDQLQELMNDSGQIANNLRSILLTMSDEDEETRAWAVDCLQLLDTISEEQAAEIEDLCSHQVEFVVHWVCRMLGKSTKVRRFEKPLVELLTKHPSAGVRQNAVLALQQLGSPSEETIAALQVAANHQDVRLKRLASEALQQFGV